MLPLSSVNKYLPDGHITPFQNIDPSILKTDVACSFTTQANFHQAAWRRFPDDGIVETTLM
jgi:hypothetical protein